MNELIRKPENVFVDIKDLNEVSPVTPIEALYSDGSNFEVTPEPESTPVRAVASAEEVRIYRINPNGKRHHILTEPSWTPETDTFCQMHSDLTGCVVEAHDALCSASVFQPTNPPERPTDPPISDKVKVVAGNSCRSRRFDNPNCCRLGSIHDIIGGIA